MPLEEDWTVFVVIDDWSPATFGVKRAGIVVGALQDLSDALKIPGWPPIVAALATNDVDVAVERLSEAHGATAHPSDEALFVTPQERVVDIDTIHLAARQLGLRVVVNLERPADA